MEVAAEFAEEGEAAFMGGGGVDDGGVGAEVGGGVAGVGEAPLGVGVLPLEVPGVADLESGAVLEDVDKEVVDDGVEGGVFFG